MERLHQMHIHQHPIFQLVLLGILVCIIYTGCDDPFSDEVGNLFPHTSLLLLYNPENGATLDDNPTFEWQSSGTSLTDEKITIILGTKFFVVDTRIQAIQNKTSIFWTWWWSPRQSESDTNSPIVTEDGTYEVPYANGLRISHTVNGVKYESGAGIALISNTRYYWAVIAYNTLGQPTRSSKVYSFTFQ
jgi:hypothetical protein